MAVPSKNRPVEVVRCLESVLARSPSVDEIIVVDQTAQPYVLPPDPRIVHVHRPELSGLTAARNAAIDLASGDIVLFSDDDVVFESDVVAEVRAAFAADPRLVGVQPAIVDPDYKPPPLSHRLFQRGFFDAHTFFEGSAVKRMSGCSMAFRAELLKHERFDEALHGYCYGEDWEFSMRAKRHGRLALAEGAKVVHRPAPTSRLDDRRFFQMRWTNFHYFYRKLRPRPSLADRFWYRWWELGEFLQWLRLGYGLARGPRMPLARDEAKR